MAELAIATVYITVGAQGYAGSNPALSALSYYKDKEYKFSGQVTLWHLKPGFYENCREFNYCKRK
jgi:hypothetical protein